MNQGLKTHINTWQRFAPLGNTYIATYSNMKQRTAMIMYICNAWQRMATHDNAWQRLETHGNACNAWQRMQRMAMHGNAWQHDGHRLGLTTTLKNGTPSNAPATPATSSNVYNL
jgi:hypothetical protein